MTMHEQQVERHLPDNYKLGPFVAEFKQTNIAGAIALSIVIAAVGLVLTYIGLVGVTDLGSTLFLVSLGLGAIGLALWGLYRFSQDRGLRVLLFSDGFVRQTQDSEVIVPWKDIVSVWQSITSWRSHGAEAARTYVYTILLNDNTQTKLYNLQKIQQLGQVIQHQVLRHQLPHARQTLTEGGQVSFGKLIVSAKGLTRGSTMVPWEEIDSVDMVKGSLKIYRRKGKGRSHWFSIKLARIPNLSVFLTLVGQCHQLHAS